MISFKFFLVGKDTKACYFVLKCSKIILLRFLFLIHGMLYFKKAEKMKMEQLGYFIILI